MAVPIWRRLLGGVEDPSGARHGGPDHLVLAGGRGQGSARGEHARLSCTDTGYRPSQGAGTGRLDRRARHERAG